MGDEWLPYDYQMMSNGEVIGLSFSASVNLNMSFYTNQYTNGALINVTNPHIFDSTGLYFLNSSITVRVYGVVKEGETIYGWGMPSQVTYFIEAEKVEVV
jgi:hypothetical protein